MRRVERVPHYLHVQTHLPLSCLLVICTSSVYLFSMPKTYFYSQYQTDHFNYQIGKFSLVSIKIKSIIDMAFLHIYIYTK